VQPIGQPGKPAAFVRVENVPALQLNPVNDQRRIDRGGVGRALGSQLQWTEKPRDRQKVPKMQQNSSKRNSGERAGR
jgi:hypothetical protein